MWEANIRWEFAYVYAIKSPPRLRQLIGTAAHEAVELNYTQKMATGDDLPLPAVLDRFSDAFDREAGAVIPDKEETTGAGKDSGIKTLTAYHRHVSPTVQPILVEQNVTFKVNGVPFSGYIDVVDSHRRIRDLKTVKQRPSRSDYAFNMTGYAVGFRQLTGETESGVQLDYMVRTKEPYHWPITQEGPVPDSAIGAFASVVGEVASAVKKGVFVPTGVNNNACSWCGFASICKYARTS